VANLIELSVSRSNAALCQITLTTCLLLSLISFSVLFFTVALADFVDGNV